LAKSKERKKSRTVPVDPKTPSILKNGHKRKEVNVAEGTHKKMHGTQKRGGTKSGTIKKNSNGEESKNK